MSILSSIVMVIVTFSIIITPLVTFSPSNFSSAVWIDSNKNNVYDSGEWSGDSIKSAIENATSHDIIHVERKTSDALPISIDKPVKICGSNVKIDGKGSDTIFIINCSNVSIEGFILANSSRFGIRSDGFNDVYVANTTIINCGEGIGLYHSNSSKITSNSIYDCMFGIFVGFSKNIEVCNNVLRNSSIGVQASGLSIHNNVISHLSSKTWVGIHCLAIDGDVTIEIINNTISNNTCGIFFYSERGYSIYANIHFNNITGNSKWGILNFSPFIVNATYNWWGASDGPSGAGNGSGDRVSENVSFYPWLFLTEKNKPPSIKILKPQKYRLYIMNKSFAKLKRLTVIVGPILIQVNCSDSDGNIEKVEFFIDDDLEHQDVFPPYSWLFNKRLFGFHEIKIKAYDDLGASSEDKIQVFIINLGLFK